MELHFISADSGGVGKTTLAMALLASMKTLFEREAVIFVDLNENNTTLFETLCYNYREYRFGPFKYECGTGTNPDEYFGIRNRHFQRYNMKQFGALLTELIKPENWPQLEQAWMGTRVGKYARRPFANNSKRKTFIIDTNHTLRNLDLLFQPPTNLLAQTGKEPVRCYFWHVITARKPTQDQVNSFFNLQFPSLRDMSRGRGNNYSEIIFVLNFWDILRDQEKSILEKLLGDQTKLTDNNLKKWNLNRYMNISDDKICTTGMSNLDAYRALEEIRASWPRHDLTISSQINFMMKNFQQSTSRIAGCRGDRLPWNLFIIDFYQRYWDQASISNRPNISQMRTELDALGEIVLSYMKNIFYIYRGR